MMKVKDYIKFNIITGWLTALFMLVAIGVSVATSDLESANFFAGSFFVSVGWLISFYVDKYQHKKREKRDEL